MGAERGELRALGASANRPSPPPEMFLLPPISRGGVPGTGHKAQMYKQSKTAPTFWDGAGSVTGTQGEKRECPRIPKSAYWFIRFCPKRALPFKRSLLKSLQAAMLTFQ